MMDYRKTLGEADFAPLLMSYVQMSGDKAVLKTYQPFITGPWSFFETVPEPLKKDLIEKFAHLLENIPDLSNYQGAFKPTLEETQEMLNVCVGQVVPKDYLGLIQSETQLADGANLDIDWRRAVAHDQLKHFKVLIIGAGESGICASIKLTRLGIEHTLIEKNSTVGGTWFENRYPGCGVDTPNHFYQYSFEPNHDWSRYFSQRKEIWQYLEKCADQYGVRQHVRFNTEVTQALWSEELKRWCVDVKTQDGQVQRLQAQAIICAVGQLNRPSIPDIKGMDAFEGPLFHSARWNDQVNLKGLRLGMIGTGASGMQIGPTVLDEVSELHIFQRTPHWATHNPLYFSEVLPGKKWALKNLPFYAQWYRFQLFWASADGLYPTLKRDPTWEHPDISMNALNHEMRKKLIDHIRKEVNDDPVLMEKIIPQYPPYGKRMLRDNHWYRSLTNPKVSLQTQAISHIGKDAIHTVDGQTHRVDAIVLATGFMAGKLTWPMHIVGRGGESLLERWAGDNPKAYLGMTVPNFPNFYLMYGPNTNLAHGGSAIFHSECQTRYILSCLRELIENNHTSMECKERVHDQFNDKVDAIHRDMVWSHPAVSSWFKNNKGRVFATSPWRMLDYWEMTRNFQPDDYVYS
jgi:4-hydroxyacetophenone monooxygenase